MYFFSWVIVLFLEHSRSLVCFAPGVFDALLDDEGVRRSRGRAGPGPLRHRAGAAVHHGEIKEGRRDRHT